MRSSWSWLVVAGVCLAFANAVRADELVFRNGDRLSGRIVHLIGGKLAFDSDLLGRVEIAADALQNVVSTEPIEIHTVDGSVFTDRAVMGEAGELRTQGSSRVGAQAFRLAEIASINPPPPEPVRWHGSITAGAEFERGNSITNEADLDVKAQRESDQARISFAAEYEGERTENRDTGVGTTTEREIEGELKYDYFLSDKWYWYGRSKGEKDGVENLDLRFGLGGGVGYRWFKTERTTLELESGLNWISEHYENSDEDEDYVGGLFSWHFLRRLSDNVSLFSDGDFVVDLEEWDDRFVLDADLGLRNQLTAAFFLEAKVEWDYDAEPSSGIERLDVDYIFGLGYRF